MKGNQIICLEVVCAREGKGNNFYFRCFTVPNKYLLMMTVQKNKYEYV